MQESVRVAGALCVSLRGDSGVRQIAVHNMVVGSGHRLLAALLTGHDGPAAAIAIGAGARPKSVDDVDLEQALCLAPISSPKADGAVARFAASFPAVTKPLRFCEAGLFNKQGVLISRAVFDGQVQCPGDALDIEWVIKFS